ncbi:MAG: substrate-binding domain-containing protein [Verrucomicrobia bacterium]|jgi:LacI family transcriptional regulator|nr:substrate-binding domain-containing protein [Verrucomicrobiota bacterium]MBT7068085.1 substrate-binding domain-containing protein [Verrucomicrobiota bacterium]MBT7701806.1 substrate-binding domain-containing protein [Verrucomicrobiota bacterium]
MKQLNMDGMPQAGRQKVLLGFQPDEAELEAVFELADAWNWQLLGLGYLGGSIPSDLVLSGALIADLPGEALAEELRTRGCPAVRFGKLPHPQDNVLPAVLPDQAAAGRMAAEHFVERRFKELGIVTYNASNPDMDNHALWCAFCERAEELGVRCHSHEQIQPGDSVLSKEERFSQRASRLAAWVADIPKPVGILTASDEMAHTLYTMCAREKIRVPEDVAILGRGRGCACRLSLMPLSSVDMQELEHIREAMRLLKRLMAGEPAPTSPVMVPPLRIVERESTDVLAVSDPTVARALRYIWENIHTDPSVDMVANTLGIQRRTLERGFRGALGCGVKAEIMRRRLQVYCRLLRSSDEPIVELSARMGYRSLESMHRQFRKATGISPGVYRRAKRGRGEKRD